MTMRGDLFMGDNGERYNLFTDGEGNLEVYVPAQQRTTVNSANKITVTGEYRYQRVAGLNVNGYRAILHILDGGWPVTLWGVLRTLPPIPNRTAVVQ